MSPFRASTRLTDGGKSFDFEVREGRNPTRQIR